jgi:hypothetical protein
MQNYWLSVWSNAVAAWPPPTPADQHGEPFPVVFYMSTYFGIGLTAIVVQLFATFVLVVATLNASQVPSPPPRSINNALVMFLGKAPIPAWLALLPIRSRHIYSVLLSALWLLSTMLCPMLCPISFNLKKST